MYFVCFVVAPVVIESDNSSEHLANVIQQDVKQSLEETHTNEVNLAKACWVQPKRSNANGRKEHKETQRKPWLKWPETNAHLSGSRSGSSQSFLFAPPCALCGDQSPNVPEHRRAIVEERLNKLISRSYQEGEKEERISSPLRLDCLLRIRWGDAREAFRSHSQSRRR